MDDRTAKNLNPYHKVRSLPVGQLHYPLPKQRKLTELAAELDFGEREFLYHLPLLAGGGLTCNLGDGGSTTIMALSLIDHGLPGTVYTVDISGANLRRNKAKRVGLEVDGRIEQLHASTELAYAQLSQHRFRLLFIDADHSYESCKKDCDLYRELVLPDGMMGFHDVNQEGVDQVVRELPAEWKLLFFVNRIKVFSRR